MGRDVELTSCFHIILLLSDPTENVDLKTDVSLDDLPPSVADGDNLSLGNDLMVLELEESISNTGLITDGGLDKSQLLAVLEIDDIEFLLSLDNLDLDVETTGSLFNILDLNP